MSASVLLLFLVGPATLRGVDADGMPLPPGAVFRLGSLRWQAPAGFVAEQVAVAPGGIVLAAGPGGVHAWAPDGVPLTLPMFEGACGFHFTADGKEVLVPRINLGPAPSVTIRRLTWPAGKALPDAHGPVSVKRGTILVRFRSDGRRAVLLPAEATPALLFLDAKKGPIPVGEKGDNATFLLGGKAFALAGGGGLSLHDSDTGRAVRTMRERLDSRAPPQQLIPSPDGSSLYERDDADILRHDARTGKVEGEMRLPGHVAALSPDGRTFALMGEGAVRLFDAPSLRPRFDVPLDGRPDAPDALTFTPGGDEVVTVTEGCVRRYSRRKGMRTNGRPGHERNVTALAWSPDGALLATADAGGKVILWDAIKGSESWAITRRGGAITALAFSPDGDTLAAGDSRPGNKGEVALVRVRDGRVMLVFEAHSKGVTSLAFFDGGKKIGTAGGDRCVRWWDAWSGVRTGEGGRADSRILAGDGRHLYFHERDWIWRLHAEEKSPRLVRSAIGRVGGIHTIKGGAAVHVLIGDDVHVPSREEIEGRFGVRIILDIYSRSAWPHGERYAFAPRGDVIAGMGGRVAAMPSRRTLATLPPASARAFSADGRWLASASGHTVVIHDVTRLRLAAALADWSGDGRLAADTEAGARLLARRLASSTRGEFERLLRLLWSADEKALGRVLADLEANRVTMARWMQAALERGQPADVASRLQAILAMNAHDAEAWADDPRRAELAVTALRLVGTPAARRAVEHLAAEGGDTPAGKAARRALTEGD